MLTPNDYSFYVLRDFNLANIDWTTPSTDHNEFYESFNDFCTDNFLIQVN